jgi:hypothetical protein
MHRVKPMIAAVVVGCAGASLAVICWRARERPTNAEVIVTEGRGAAPMSSAPFAGRDLGAQPDVRLVRDAEPSPQLGVAAAPGRPGVGVAGAPSSGAELRWPAPRSGHARAASAAASGEPEVPVELAFRSLWYLGVDPEAERTWTRAINDRNLPAGVRSDLIVDMIDEGYTDNGHPAEADLPTILARLSIVERHAPHAMDEVNRAAFEDAYRHLLSMYLRLAGKATRAR